MPSISKEFGVSFNDFSVDNDGNYFLADVQRPIKPKQNYTAQYLPGRSETVYGSGGYQDILVNVVVGIRYSSEEDRINKINTITKAWCFSESKLKLRHSAFYYVGKVLDEVSIGEDGMYTLLTFPFICKPFMYSEDKEVTLTANTSVDYQGDYKCQPILKFTGTGTHTITCNGESFTITGNNKDITVDCNKGIVYYNDISNAMTQFSGDFITLNPETVNTIAWTVTTGSTAPTLIYQDTNLAKLSYTDYSYTPSGGGSSGGGSGGGTVDEDTVVNVLKNKIISTLTTTVKTVVGAINSLKSLIDGTFNNASITGNIITLNKVDGTTKTLEIGAGTQGPQGEPGADGKAATVTIGTVASGTTTNVTNTGTSTDAILNFTLQKGDKGDTGATGTWDTTTQYPTLTTTDKTVIGGINENKVAIDANAQQINVLSTKTPFVCTAQTGYKILSQDCYRLCGNIYINLAVAKEDESVFAISSTPYYVVQTPFLKSGAFNAISISGLNQIGTGIAPFTLNGIIAGYRGIYVNVISGTPKELIISAILSEV